MATHLKRIRWTPGMIALLEALFPYYTRPAIANLLGLGEQQIRHQQRQSGLKKADPVAFCTAHQRSTPNAGRFKKGHLPQTTAPEGDHTVRCRLDNRQQPQLMIRLKLGHWDYLSRYVWQTFFGPIPATRLVTFIDSDSLNCHPDNLRLMSRQQNMRRNVNPPKAAQTMKRLYAEDRIDNPPKRLHDDYVLGTISRDPLIQERIRRQTPGLIGLKRELLLLKRTNKNHTDDEAYPT